MKTLAALYAGDELLVLGATADPLVIRTVARSLLQDAAPPAVDDELAAARHAALRKIAGTEVSR